MGRWIAVVLGMLACVMAQAAELPRQIRLVSEQWTDYTNADGSGLAWDVLRKVFEPVGVKVSVRAEPYTRAIGLVEKGEADAWVGSYKNEINQALYPRWNYDTDHIYALGRVEKPVPTPEDIGSYRLAWVRGYEYQHYLPSVKLFNEVQRRKGILPMLDHDRADFYVDAETEIHEVLRDAHNPRDYRVTHVAELPLYLGFADSAEGRELMRLFDKRMSELVPSGELRPIFERWNQPYPFDDLLHGKR